MKTERLPKEHQKSSSYFVSDIDEAKVAQAQKVLRSIPNLGIAGGDRAENNAGQNLLIGAAITIGAVATWKGVGKLFDIYVNLFNPFKEVLCSDSFSPSLIRNNPSLNSQTPNPIFDQKTSKLIEFIRIAPSKAIQDKEYTLPHVIISGKMGTGKTTVCNGIAKGGNWNYCLFTESQFSELLQSETSSKFFQKLRDHKLPTVIVIDQADALLGSDDENKKKVVEKFTSINEVSDNKLMFIFNTELPINKIKSKAFLSRMNYQINLNLPGPKELKEIIQQNVNSMLSTPLLEVFTPEVSAFLAGSVFKGKSGREVQKAINDLAYQSDEQLSPNQIHDHIKEYFNAYRYQ